MKKILFIIFAGMAIHCVAAEDDLVAAKACLDAIRTAPFGVPVKYVDMKGCKGASAVFLLDHLADFTNVPRTDAETKALLEQASPQAYDNARRERLMGDAMTAITNSLQDNSFSEYLNPIMQRLVAVMQGDPRAGIRDMAASRIKDCLTDYSATVPAEKLASYGPQIYAAAEKWKSAKAAVVYGLFPSADDAKVCQLVKSISPCGLNGARMGLESCDYELCAILARHGDVEAENSLMWVVMNIQGAFGGPEYWTLSKALSYVNTPRMRKFILQAPNGTRSFRFKGSNYETDDINGIYYNALQFMCRHDPMFPKENYQLMRKWASAHWGIGLNETLGDLPPPDWPTKRKQQAPAPAVSPVPTPPPTAVKTQTTDAPIKSSMHWLTYAVATAVALCLVAAVLWVRRQRN